MFWSGPLEGDEDMKTKLSWMEDTKELIHLLLPCEDTGLSSVSQDADQESTSMNQDLAKYHASILTSQTLEW